MNTTARLLLRVISALSVAVPIGMGIPSPLSHAWAAGPQVSFSEDILPLLQWRCAGCHRPGGQGFEKSGFDLTSYQGVMKGTKFGPMVIARSPETSSLMRLLDWQVAPEIRMPHGKKKLSACDRNAVRSWIREGAKNN
jgi:hypothetical protein